VFDLVFLFCHEALYDGTAGENCIFDGLKTTYLVAAGLWYGGREYYTYLSKVIFYN
jgi:hypothetical protein